MLRRTILSAAAVTALFTFGAFASVTFTSSETRAQSAPNDSDETLPQKIREKLTAQGYEDVEIAPGSYVVSARDKDGKRVMMLIGPTSMTVMKLPDAPSTARVPDEDNEIIQQ